jgi:hypothetical protein
VVIILDLHDRRRIGQHQTMPAIPESFGHAQRPRRMDIGHEDGQPPITGRHTISAETVRKPARYHVAVPIVP